MTPRMGRRQFLVRAGLTSIATATLLEASTATAVAAGPRVSFRLVSNSRTSTVGGIRHLAQLNGEGIIVDSEVVGGGTFNHVLDTSPVPKTILASGTWKARRLLEFHLIGTYGAIAAGMTTLEIDLVPRGEPVRVAVLEVVCNLGAAGLFTGEEEGFVLSIPGTPFTSGGTFGPFEPFVPVAGGPTQGLSVFNLLNEHRD